MSQSSTAQLHPDTLSACAELVPAPTYDRSSLTVGIVHFGVGAFHRAHQAAYLDRLMNAGDAFDWAICGVGVMEADRATQEALKPQGYLYTLVEKDNDGGYEPRIIGSIIVAFVGAVILVWISRLLRSA